MIAIIDYGMGNLRSVQNALERSAARGVTEDPRVIEEPRLVLPGVGAFRDCMRNLRGVSSSSPRTALDEAGRFSASASGCSFSLPRARSSAGHQGLGDRPRQGGALSAGLRPRGPSSRCRTWGGTLGGHPRPSSPIFEGSAERGRTSISCNSHDVSPTDPAVVAAAT